MTADRDTRTEAAAKAIVMVETAGCCDKWPRPCQDCDCFRDARPVERAARDRQRAREALAAADADDLVHGIVRVRLDDEVTRLADYLRSFPRGLSAEHVAAAVLTLLREAVQP